MAACMAWIKSESLMRSSTCAKDFCTLCVVATSYSHISHYTLMYVICVFVNALHKHCRILALGKLAIVIMSQNIIMFSTFQHIFFLSLFIFYSKLLCCLFIPLTVCGAFFLPGKCPKITQIRTQMNANIKINNKRNCVSVLVISYYRPNILFIRIMANTEIYKIFVWITE